MFTLGTHFMLIKDTPEWTKNNPRTHGDGGQTPDHAAFVGLLFKAGLDIHQFLSAIQSDQRADAEHFWLAAFNDPWVGDIDLAGGPDS